MNCPLIKQKFQELKALKQKFETQLEKTRHDGKPCDLFALKAEIEEKLIDIKSQPGMESLNNELTGNIAEQIKTAQEILGVKNVITPQDTIDNFKFTINQSEIPKIPFSRQELERSAELGQFLVFRPQGITTKYIKDYLKDKKTDDNKPFFYSQDWYENDKEKHIFEEETKEGWALVDKEPIKIKDKNTDTETESTSKDYVQQSKMIKEYLKEIYQDQDMPEKYQKAIEEFNEYLEKEFQNKTEDEINKIIDGKDWRKYAEELSSLELNQITRQTPTEAIFDIFSYYLKNKERIMKNRYTLTKRLDSDGSLVSAGYFDFGGLALGRGHTDARDDDLGVSSSRS